MNKVMQKSDDRLPSPPVRCDPLFDLLRGYEEHRLVTSAVELGVFSHLREPVESLEVAERLGTDAVLTEKFLSCLAAVGLVSKDGAAFVNTELAETYLVPESPFSQMNLIALIGKGEKLWDRVPAALRGEAPEPGGPRRMEAVFDKSFIVAMAEGAVRGGLQTAVKALAEWPEFERAERLLDFGGGHGLYGIDFARASPTLKVTIFDLPPVIEVAREYVERHGMEGRIDLMAGDFTTDEIGKGYDIIFASDAFYRPADVLRPVLDKVRSSLRGGGLFVTKHWAMNPDRMGPITTVLWEFRIALGVPGHYVYDNDEYLGLLSEAGFESFEIIDISTKAKPSTLVLSRTPDGG